MRLKNRLVKLEEHKQAKQQNLIFVFDGMVSYKNKKIKKDEFIKLNPQLKDNDFLEIVLVEA
ncbi:hypothetical protein HOC73_04320 [bacterium]|jgi:hypothetical protein|nr:hypothetical protein [bacterium]MBT4495942.1 hypothetical protein [bacterium]MBT7830302.1 hypothetical protein [Candidatus Neomarinimicrobiota bacterium]